ncbi:MAG: Hsp20/alpha crystallin family protein [candidate division Zixibacteria bacterium]|nr:Hsp20/alpha crystallin family protein [candidate division Zixibacteria bacterium]
MTLVQCNPNRLMMDLNKDVDSVIDSFLNFPSIHSSNRWAFVPRVNIAEDTDNLRIVAEVPGMEKDDVKVSIEDDLLTISGERKSVSESKDASHIRTELRTGSFSRSFTLPGHVDLTKVTADYKNGLLSITLPKTEKSKPREIKVDVK